MTSKRPVLASEKTTMEPVWKHPALWHRARNDNPSISRRSMHLNLRRIWDTFEDRIYGVLNRIKRQRF